jgi:hypothetical protein
LPPLSAEQSKVLYDKIVATLDRRPALPEELVTDRVFRFSGGSPFWLIELLEGWRGEDLDVARLRREFAREKALARVDAIAPSVGMSQSQGYESLGWLALYQPVNRQDEAVLTFIAQMCGAPPDNLLRLYDAFAASKLLARRRRLFEIAPEAMRLALAADFLGPGPVNESLNAKRIEKLLLQSLTSGDGQVVPDRDRLVTAIGIVQRTDGHEEAPLLRSVGERILSEARRASTPSDQRRWFEMGRALNASNPSLLVELVSVVRQHQTGTEEIDSPWVGKKVVSHDELVDDLAWPLFESAGFAHPDTRKKLLREMLALVAFEAVRRAENAPKRNDGKRPDDLIGRIVRGEAEFSADY